MKFVEIVSPFTRKISPRAWYCELQTFHCNMGSKTLSYNTFYFQRWNQQSPINDFVNLLANLFSLKDLGSLSYFLGIEIIPNQKEILLYSGATPWSSMIIQRCSRRNHHMHLYPQQFNSHFIVIISLKMQMNIDQFWWPSISFHQSTRFWPLSWTSWHNLCTTPLQIIGHVWNVYWDVSGTINVGIQPCYYSFFPLHAFPM